MLLNLLLVYIGNWAGTLFVAYFFGYLTNLFDHKQQVEFLSEVVVGKLEAIGGSLVDRFCQFCRRADP